MVGIDEYPGFGPESQLAGAVRDARTMAEVLIAGHGFAPGDVLRRQGAEATQRSLRGALETLRQRVAAGDRVLFYFSGHGSQMTDREGDEGDGLDETLVPCDSGRGEDENRDLSDDEINLWAARVLAVTPHLTLIFDCCHAATLHRPGWRVRSVPADLRPVAALPPSPVSGLAPPLWRDVATGPRPRMLAACRDDERAYEVPPAIAGQDRGAFSFHLAAALRDAAPGATWREVFARASSALAADCRDQHPQLSGDGLDLPLFSSGSNQASSHGRRLLALGARPDRFGLRIELFRSRGGAWRRCPAAGLGEVSFLEGDRLRVDLSHGHDGEVFAYLLDIGLTATVTLLFPDPDGHEVLDPGVVLTVGGRRGDALELFLPEDLPTGDSAGIGHLVLVAAERRLSTARLLAGSVTDLTGVSAVVRPYRLFRR